MSRYKLEKLPSTESFDSSHVVVEFDATGLEEMLEYYRDFLKAVGFQVNEIIQVEDEEE